MSKMKEKILSLGRRECTAEIAEFLGNQDPREIAEEVRRSLSAGDGPAMLLYILQGLQTKVELERACLLVIKTAIKELAQSMAISASSMKTFVEELEMAVGKLNSESLADLTEVMIRLVEDINEMSGDETDVSWIQIFAGVIKEITEKEFITPKDTHVEISGAEYRTRIISTLCDVRWHPRTSIAMIIMFRDCKLSNQEIEEVFTKANTSLTRSSMKDIAPLFHQVLKMLKNSASCSGKLISTITQYFSSKLTIAERQSADSAPTMDSVELIESDHSAEEVQQAEGMVVYYITQAAKVGHPIAKEVSKLTRSFTSFPAAIMNPFSLFNCLAITSVKHLKEAILDGLKQSISKGYSMEDSRRACVWYRTQTPAIPDIASLFSLIISQSSKHGGWDLIGQGLVDLSFLLLDVQPPLGKMNRRTRSIHQLGAGVLTKVIKKHSSSVQIIVPRLMDRMVIKPKATQYTSALMQIIKDATTYFMEDGNGAVIAKLIEKINLLSYAGGRSTLNALIPLLKVNRTLRNPLILVLRKSLFSQNVQTRMVGVSGVYTLLKTFKISTSLISSQLSQSSGSLSQLSIDIHRGSTATNDALCAELLGVLKRCFSLQPEVKMIFYRDMITVISKNPELCEGFLDLLYLHALELFEGVNGNLMPDLDFDKTLVQRNGTWSISEPAGWFLHCLQTIVSKGQQLMDAGDCAVLDKLGSFLDRLCTKYGEADIQDLGFDPSDNYDRKSVEGKKRSCKVDILLNVYEALMEYLIDHGVDKHLNKTDLFLKLLHNHISLRNLLNTQKPRKTEKKGEKSKKFGAGEETIIEKDDAKEVQASKRPAADEKVEEFQMDQHAQSLRSMSVILQSVLENRSPEKQSSLSKLRDHDGFLAFLHASLTTLLDRSHNQLLISGDQGEHSELTFKHLLNITATLFRHSITSLEPVFDFLVPSSELVVTYVKVLMESFPRRKLVVIKSLAEMDSGKATEQNLNPVLVPCLNKIMKRISSLSEDLEKDDEADKKLISAVRLSSVLMKEINGEQPHEGYCEKLKKFGDQFTSEDPAVCKPIVELTFLANLRLQFSGSLCPRTARQLHCIYGDLDTTREVEMSKNLGFLSEETAEMVLPILIEHMDSSIEYADQAITWLKTLVGLPSPMVNMAATELAVTEHIAKMVSPSMELVNTALPVGPMSTLCLKFLTKLYRILGNLANYFFLRTRYCKSSVTASKLDKLVKMVGTQLSPNVYCLITFIQKKYKEQDDEAKAARAKKNKILDPNIARAKVLRETKEIPNLIFHIENFEKNIAKVGKRINQKFEFRLPTSRDFRIRLTEDHMKELNDEDTDEDSDEESGAEDEEEGGRHQSSASQSQVAVLSLSNRPQDASTAHGDEPAAKKSKLSAKLSKMKENRTQRS